MRREAFLDRVSAALRGATLPEITGPDEAPRVRFDDPVGRFVERATAVDAEVVRVSSTEEALEMCTDTVQYIAWDDVVPGFHDAMSAAGSERVSATVETPSRLDDQARIGAVPVGFTTADAAIAATGSLLLSHGPGRPRSASLYVEEHVVLLPAERIVHSLADAMRMVRWVATSSVVAITGPSRTGDIESILTLGVHGPRRLRVVLIG